MLFNLLSFLFLSTPPLPGADQDSDSVVTGRNCRPRKNGVNVHIILLGNCLQINEQMIVVKSFLDDL